MELLQVETARIKARRLGLEARLLAAELHGAVGVST
jgi:hypothetical protein